MPGNFGNDGDAYAHAASLRSSVITIVHGGTNLGRLESAYRRAEELGLEKRIRFEPIDWFSVQKNMVIDVAGVSSHTIYVVAHYDKTDSSILTLASLLMNGALDEVKSPVCFSEGAIDNASGVAVVLELASTINRTKPHYSYRFLISGSEESGLRGSRAHIARLTDEERAVVDMAVNIDAVGVISSPNCVSNDTGAPELLEQIKNVARDLKVDLGDEPAGTTDHIPFKKTDPWRDVLLGFQFNYIGGMLPQRSWFTKPFSVPVVNFTACGLVEPSNDFFDILFIPLGNIHGIHDRLDQISVTRLYEQFLIVREFLGIQEKRAEEAQTLSVLH